MKPTSIFLSIVLAISALCSMSSAQVQPAGTGGTTVVSAAGEVVAYRALGSWSVANHNSQSFDVLDWGAQKGSSLSAEVHEFIAPTPALNSYLAGVKIVPDISGIIGKSNLSADQFQIFGQFAAGETTVPSGAKTTIMAGGGVSFMLTPNLTWKTADGYLLRFNGANTYAISSGLQWIFNGQSSPSFAVHRMMVRAAKKAAAVRR